MSITPLEDTLFSLSLCLEGLLFGIYSGIFAVYLQRPSTKSESESRTTNFVFYALCLLYAFCAATFVGDLLSGIFSHIAIISTQWLQILNGISIAHLVVGACCDFTSQCIIIYRCWIVWGQNIRIVIIPSFLAITLLATWIVYALPSNIGILFVTGLAASMAVNTLMTGMIVFKILKVTAGVKPTSIERTLGSAGGNKFQHIMFVIIESGMALFAIQLARFVVVFIVPATTEQQHFLQAAADFVIVTNQMLNGIAPTIIFVRVSMKMSFDDEESFKEAIESLRFNSSDPPNKRQQLGSSSSIPLEDFERNEDNITQNASDPITLRRVGGGSNLSIQEIRSSGDIQVFFDNPPSNPEFTGTSANGM